MTINSLASFGVPSISGQRSPLLQPTFRNKFRATFYDFGNGRQARYDLTRQIQKMGRPKTRWDVQSLYRYVRTIYVINRGEWDELTITFLDDITNSVTTLVEMQKGKQQNFFDQTVNRAGENYKFEIDLDLLAGGRTAGDRTFDPNILQKWSYVGCMLTRVDYGELDMKRQEALMINCTVRYDNVVGFDQNGNMMGDFDIDAEIAARQGTFRTGVGAGAGSTINIRGARVRVQGFVARAF